MSKKFNLNSRFEVEGVFWTSSTPNEKFSGHLSANERGIELTTAATISNVREFFTGSQTRNAPEQLMGLTTLGNCTLIDIHETAGPQHADMRSGEVLSSRRFRVSLCLIGMHVTDPSVVELSSARCTYSGLGQWLRPTSQVHFAEDSVSIRYPTEERSLLDFCVIARKLRVSVSVRSDVQLRVAGYHSAANVPTITIESAESTSLDKLLDAAYRIEEFFNLILGTSIRLQTFYVEIAGDHDGWLVRRRRGKTGKFDLQSSFACEPSQLSAALSTWLSVPEDARPFQRLVFGTLREGSMFVETEFLALAQALESFHRSTLETTLAEASVYEKTCNAILQALAKTLGNPPLSRRLEEAVRSTNEPSFKDRIESLTRKLSEKHRQELLGDAIAFEQTLRRTRNYFTHLGITRRPGVLTNTGDLFLFNQKLHAFLRLLMLIDLGFAEDLVFESVLYQSRKWKLF